MERLSISPNTTFEFALWCKLLRDRGYTGMQVSRQLGKSEGYVNNLVRILERASLPILERWCHEQRPNSGLFHACATDWLMQVCVLPHGEQDVQLADRIARLGRTPANGTPSGSPAGGCITHPRARPPTNPPARAPTDPGDATRSTSHECVPATDVPDPPVARTDESAR
jgi:hypothetical protein